MTLQGVKSMADCLKLQMTLALFKSTSPHLYFPFLKSRLFCQINNLEK